MNTRTLLLPAILLALGTTATHATPGVDRILRRTQHFQLAIDRSRESDLDSLGTWAESSWQKLSKISGYAPAEPIRIVFHDEDDYSNGWAMASNGWVNVWLLPQPFDLRGGSDWIRNVLSHELSHVFTLRALGQDGHLLYFGIGARTSSRTFEGDLDLVARPNDLEAWLAEGLAQVGAESCGHDSWDAYRDLLEHVAWKSSRTLPDGLLRTFWGDARESELVYNQGYSFLRWVVSEGSSDFAKLLADGRKDGLRSAVETSMGRKFPVLLSQWRDSLERRHGPAVWPTEVGRPVLPVDAAATWVHESSAVGDGHGTIWVASSRSNDFGRSSLWESGRKGLGKIAGDVHGRIRLSADGKRILLVREESGVDRRIVRDLWLYQVESGEMEAITEDARIQDADFHPEGYVVVVREGGANRVRIVDPRGSTLRTLPLAAGGDLVQVAGDPAGGIVATSMGRDGFRLIRADSGGAWTPIPGIGTQARDPLWRQGRLWYSSLDSGIWVASSLDSLGPHLEARSEGGTFAPFPLADDSILVLRFQTRGQLASKVPRSSGSTVSGRASPRSLPPPPAMPERRWRTVPGNPLEAGSLVGYGLLLGVQRPMEDPRSAFRQGSRGFLQAGILAGNSSLENTLEANILVQATGSDQRNAIDAGWALHARSEAWAPVLDASYSSMRTTLEYVRGSDDGLDTVFRGDTVPYVTTTTYELGGTLRLSRHASMQTWFDHADQTMGAHGLDEGMDAQVRTMDQWLGRAVWSDFESGRHGVLSGIGISLGGGRSWNWIASKTLVAPDYWFANGNLRLAGNLSRRLLVGVGLAGTLMGPDGFESKSMGTVEAEVGIPLAIPPLRIPLGSHRGWTLVDPILRLGHLADIRPMSLSRTDDFRQTSSIPPLDGKTEDRIWRIDPLESAEGLPHGQVSHGPDARIQQQADVDLSWKTVTLWNFLAGWSIGATVPVSRATRWSDLAWRISMSL